MTESSPTYRLPTAIAMIVGICIGSGIFFKSDNILIATGGNVPLGILVFLLGAVGIIFGGLSIGQLAARTAQPGGLIAYAAEFVGPGFTGGVGWFQVFFYFPTLVAAVSRAAGHYFAACFPFRTHWKRSAWWGSFFSRSAFFGISVPQGWVGSCKTRPPHSSSSRSCLSLFAVCFSEIRGKPSAFLPNRLPRQDGFPPSGQLRLPTMDGSSPPPSLMK